MMTRIFIIDDDPVFRLLTVKMLQRLEDASVMIHECQHGQVGLNELGQIQGITDNVIILLDLNMPVLDGWGFLEGVDSNEYYAIEELTVFIVSSSTDERDVAKAKDYHIVKDFIHKPLGMDRLKNIVYEPAN